MKTMTPTIPRDEQVDSAMQVLWNAHEQEREERRLLLELLRECGRILMHDQQQPELSPACLLMSRGFTAERIVERIRDILRGEPIATVLRPDEDPDMEVPF